MSFESYTQAVDFLSQNTEISTEDSFDLSKYCSFLLRNNEIEGRDLVIRIHDSWDFLPEHTKPIWNDITESAGLYPYVKPKYLSKSGLLRFEYHKSPFLDGVYLHEEQQQLSVELQSKRSLVVSAPTSFGKSLLIEELIASKLYKQIVVIQPTLALLDETRKKLLKYKDSYKVVVSTSQEPDDEKGNIFLFTGERVVEYDKFPSIEFFVIDEFYKLSIDRDDDRAIALNQAFHRLLKFTNKFYLLGPMIKNIPVNFKNKFELTWFPTEFATVAVDETSNIVEGKLKVKEKKELKKLNLFNYLISQNEQTIVYCSAPNRTTNLALEFLQFLKENVIKVNNPYVEENNDVIEWVKENINGKWSLNDALEFGIGFHHGAVPRHLGSTIVDYFNNGSIRWLFCTSTLIEGVNTSAKNVVLFDKKKGPKPIDFFDYKNIAGRSGRMKEHFVGNVIRFEDQPEQMELFIDIPLFNQEEAPLEILIGLEDEEIEEKAKPRLEEFNSLPDDLKDVVKLNTGISIDAQLAIVKKLESNLPYYNKELAWSSLPKSFDNLSTIIELCWDTLAGPGDKTYIEGIGRLSARWLASFAFSYINLKSIGAVINTYINDSFWTEKIPDRQKRIDTATYSILHITRHWFDYKLPKWLNVVSNLQEYVFKKNNLKYGNYSFISSSIENGFLHPNIAALSEYDIPLSAIRKLDKYINKDRTPEMNIINLNQLSDEELSSNNLLKYEISKIRSAF
ncbi:helicase-related protein [Marinicella sp. S1101]|uniref:DEAD/DEAH box helicase n=1 Tax=Marinicella marina TaxID=2996016 RepID=UPI0022608238|nr:DEAD/DEAH box helicase [Marinicella marina]MCX7554000.1 helicase-related protein [Marinicella marina]MDJ1140492.1 helicase-related protein [Marinicella marina]